jgi:formate dehydrogenase major subunit
MKVTRRSFLKLSAAGAFAATFGCTDRDRPVPNTTEHGTFRTELKTGTETTTICPFCGCGCGAVVTTGMVNGAAKVVNIEGDPDHPVNRGALCSKGAALYQMPNRPDFDILSDDNGGTRLTTPMKRVAGGTAWEAMTWPTAISEIATAMVNARAAGWNAAGNRTENLYSLGGASLDNEECYLLVKMLRAMGMVYIEHQARI